VGFRVPQYFYASRKYSRLCVGKKILKTKNGAIFDLKIHSVLELKNKHFST
jgi:hypothetical protein